MIKNIKYLIHSYRGQVILFLLIFPNILFAQQDTIAANVYQWKQPTEISKNKIASSVLIEGQAHDFKWMQVSSNTISPDNKKFKQKNANDVEQILIVKSGIISIKVKDSLFTIGANSVAFFKAGEKFQLQNSSNQSCEFFTVKYKSKLPIDMQRGNKSGGSFVMDFNQTSLKNTDKGSTRNYFVKPTASAQRLDIHLTTLKPGFRSHDPHMHKAEEMVIMLQGNTEMQIGQGFQKGTVGSVYYLSSNILHAAKNIGTEDCMYFAFQFE